MNKQLLSLIQNMVALARTTLSRYVDDYSTLPIQDVRKVEAMSLLVSALIEVEKGLDRVNRNH